MAKNDFTPKYNNIYEIQEDTALLPADVVREKVKHYSMCLFGLAADMAQHEQRLVEATQQTEQLKAENKHLRQRIKKLTENGIKPPKIRQRTQLPLLTPEEKIAANIEHYKRECGNARDTARALRIKNEQLLERIAELKKELAEAKGATDNGK